MHKIVQYLNSNLSGEVLDSSWMRLRHARDHSILRIIPEAVVLPRQTTDIRKVVKVASQLAQKGQVLQITPRGMGHDQNGGAIGRGLIINLAKFMNQVIDLDPEQGLIHVQAGTKLTELEAIANSYQLSLPLDLRDNNSVGGMISAGHVALDASKIRQLAEMIDQLELVLANGDVVQIRQLSRHELNKKIGQNDFEGEIYRQLDRLIESQANLIKSIDLSKNDYVGYNNIARVKSANGSFNLIPLLVGAQGTLGIITEAILKLDILAKDQSLGAAAFVNLDDALDTAEAIAKLKPAFVDIFHSNFFIDAMEKGKSFDFYDQAIESFGQAPSICLVFGLRHKNPRLIAKDLAKINATVQRNKGFLANEPEKIQVELRALRDLPKYFKADNLQDLPLAQDIFVPTFRFREFYKELAGIEQKLGISLPFYGSMTSNLLRIRSLLDLKQISDRQKVFRLLNIFTKLGHDLGGVYCGGAGEGRLRAPFVDQLLSPELKELFADIKTIFDPHKILNPEVKQAGALKDILQQTVNDYNNGVFY